MSGPGKTGRERSGNGPDGAGQAAGAPPTGTGRGAAPYPGLAPFGEQDARRFFGREEVTELISFLAEQRPGLPLILVGASGAGKSSLLQAGLLPRLRAAAGGNPDASEVGGTAEAGGPAGAGGSAGGSGPGGNGAGGNGAGLGTGDLLGAGDRLGAGDLEAGSLGVQHDGRVEWYDLTVTGTAGLAARIAKAVRPGQPTMTGGWALVEAAKAWGQAATGNKPASRPAAVIVDHVEAVFTLADEAERSALISSLCELARDTLVVLALRADFYGRAIRYSRLLRALQERQVVLGPMNADQLRRAVIEPARGAGADVAPDLVEAVLADMPADQPGALPLLAHALRAAWQRGDGSTLSLADYLATGGIKDAVRQSAERACQELSAGQRRLAAVLLPRLVRSSGDLPPIRVSVPLGELRRTAAQSGGKETDADAVLAALASQRLVTVDAGYARLTHDAVLTGWPQLRTWVEEQGTARRGQSPSGPGASSRAASRATSPEGASRSASPEGSGRAASPVTSAGGEVRSRSERRIRRLHATVAALVAVVLVAAGLAGYAFAQRSQADSGRQAALASSQAADSRAVAFVAAQAGATDPAAGAQLAAAAYAISPTPQAASSLLDASAAASVARVTDTAGPVRSVSVSPDGRLLAAAADNGSLRLWSIAAPGRPVAVATLAAPGGQALDAVAFSPDGTVIAAAGAGGLRLWRVTGADGGTPQASPLGGPLAAGTAVSSVAFSPDGHLLAAGTPSGATTAGKGGKGGAKGTAGGTVRLWTVTDPARPAADGKPVTVAGSAVTTVAFAAGGLLAAGTSSGQVTVWTVAGSAAPVRYPHMPLTGPGGPVTGLAFSADGKELAASGDARVWRWAMQGASKHKAASAVADGTLAGAPGGTNAVAFSPDGRLLAAGASGAGVVVWNTATGAVSASVPQPQKVTSVSWDGSGRLAAASTGGTLALVKLPLPVLAGGTAPASVAYRPDGTAVAVGGSSVQLWSAAGRALLAAHPLASGVTAGAVAYSRAGLLAAALSDGTVQLLDGQTLAAAGRAFPVAAAKGTAAAVAFSPDGRLLAAGGGDGSIRLYDVSDPAHPVQVTAATGAGHAVTAVAFAASGGLLAAADSAGTVRLWQVSGQSLTAAGTVTGTGAAPGRAP